MAEIILQKHLQKILNLQIKNKNMFLFSSLFWRNNYLFSTIKDLDNGNTTINQYSFILRKIEIFLKTLKIFFTYLIRFFLFKLFVKKISLSKSFNIFKIFFDPNFSNFNKEKNKSYYLLKNKYKSNNRTFFLPVIYNFSLLNILSFIKNINRESDKFLILEHHMSFFQLLNTLFLFSFCKKKIKINHKNKDLSKFYKYHLYDPKQLESFFLSLLYFQLVKNLNFRNKKIRNLSLIWENHPIDKAIIKASKLFYPKINIFGYLTVAPPINYQSIIPTNLESDSKLLPDYIYTTGSFIKNNLKRYTKEANVKTLSLFRAPKKIFTRSKKNNKILVILPIYVEECVYILNLIKKIFIKVKDIDNKLLIKFHPSVDSKKLFKKNKYLSALNKYVSIKDTDNLINNADKIVIGISSIYYLLICNNLNIIVLSEKFKTIKEIFGIKNTKTMLIKDENNLCKALNSKTKKMTKKFNSKLFKKIYAKI